MFPSYRNQSVDLMGKLGVKRLSSKIKNDTNYKKTYLGPANIFDRTIYTKVYIVDFRQGPNYTSE